MLTNPEVSPLLQKMKPLKNQADGRLVQEYLHFFISQTQGGSSFASQKTSTEKSVSGSMLGGYKIGKRIIVKSGIILSQLKQVTKYVDYISIYPSSEIPLNTARVNTPSGSVNLNRTAADKMVVSLANNTLQLSELQQDIKQEFRYVEIPFQIGYKLIDHKF